VIVRALLAGQGRRASAAAAGVGLRTLAEWLAKKRAGDRALAEWVRQVEAAEQVVNRRRWDARWDRETAAAKERWQRFKAYREAWYLDQFGSCEFWRRRLQWLAAEGKTSAYAATVARLQAEGFRISAVL
jgi:hypothetical protein